MDHPVLRRLDLLTTGWGFNFYNRKNLARADDLLVREKAAHRLGEATAALSALEVEYRRRFIPSATRENPFPPAEAMERLRALGRLKAAVSDRAVLIRGASVPTQDRIWDRLRSEQGLLYQLLAYDEGLIADTQRVAEMARELDAGRWDADSTGCAAAFDDPLRDLDETLRKRTDLLLMPTL